MVTSFWFRTMAQLARDSLEVGFFTTRTRRIVLTVFRNKKAVPRQKQVNLCVSSPS
jgi:hypothetical protein